MDEKTTVLQEVGAAFRDHGITAAITALVGGTIALLAAVTRKAFTNDAMLARLDRELEAEITADLPATTQFLSPRLYLNTGATAAPVAYDCSGVYVETDY